MKFYVCLLLILAISAAGGPSHGWTAAMYLPTAIAAVVVAIFMVIDYRWSKR